jgi:hypothetical protein
VEIETIYFVLLKINCGHFDGVSPDLYPDIGYFIQYPSFGLYEDIARAILPFCCGIRSISWLWPLGDASLVLVWFYCFPRVAFLRGRNHRF